jgi:hypothetical protein
MLSAEQRTNVAIMMVKILLIIDVPPVSASGRFSKIFNGGLRPFVKSAVAKPTNAYKFKDLH